MVELSTTTTSQTGLQVKEATYAVEAALVSIDGMELASLHTYSVSTATSLWSTTTTSKGTKIQKEEQAYLNAALEKVYQTEARVIQCRSQTRAISETEVELDEHITEFEKKQIEVIKKIKASKRKRSKEAYFSFNGTLEVKNSADTKTRFQTAPLKKVEYVLTDETIEELKKIIDKHVRFAADDILTYL
ncbi:hypothetical protein Droror1_Dr00022098 [Drosera rotundifolia]